MKALQIIESAYRCTVEEQDDPAVWIVHAMKGAGAELGVLLRGNAVNYAVKTQNAAGLSFGELKQQNPPNLVRDVSALLEKGIAVHVVEEDLKDRGIGSGELIAGIQNVSRNSVGKLLGSYDQIWHW